MNARELARIGEALYGRWWRDPLADDVEISYRTMRRWANGDTPIPADIPGKLRGLVKDRRAKLAEIVNELEEV